jgi:uncharacterized RDD family membrane protein YckC
VLGGLIPLLAAYLQVRWRTTPGKRLFRLRIVDAHGMAPYKSVLALRSICQFLPQWAECARSVYTLMGRQLLSLAVPGLAAIWLALDAGFAVFRRDGRSLHDLLLRTRVVLDARTEAEP